MESRGLGFGAQLERNPGPGATPKNRTSLAASAQSQRANRCLRKVIRSRVSALAIMPNPVFVTNMQRIADFAAQNGLPSIFHLREFAAVGGLVSYGVDRSDLFRRAATYVDKILKGANAAELPIEQPTKFELVINRKTAYKRCLIIPIGVLARADEVIE